MIGGKNMKKLMKVTALLMAAAMTLTACGGKTTSTETGKDTTPAKTESQAEGQTEACLLYTSRCV